MTYSVRAVPYRKGWGLHINGPGVDGATQAHTLRQVGAMARDYVATVLDLSDAAEVRLVVELHGAPLPWWREAINSLRR